MKLPKKTTSIVLLSLLGVTLIASATTILVVGADDVKITFLPSNISATQDGYEERWMSSIMIEYKGIRVYIDPYKIDEATYESKKADGIIITHPHGDHYDQDTIDFLTQDSTEFIGPTNCTEFITENGGTGVIPGDEGTIAGLSFVAIPAYNPSHPVENNWCGYVFTIEEYTILIPGDTSVISEYWDWREEIDVAILPAGWGCSNLGPEGAIEAIRVIRPQYVIPIHYGEAQYLDEFLDLVVMGTYPYEIHEQKLTLK
jgi:L-ascorbate metabolism protein UlaG (beta-lactamase superfamily)